MSGQTTELHWRRRPAGPHHLLPFLSCVDPNVPLLKPSPAPAAPGLAKRSLERVGCCRWKQKPAAATSHDETAAHARAGPCRRRVGWILGGSRGAHKVCTAEVGCGQGQMQTSLPAGVELKVKDPRGRGARMQKLRPVWVSQSLVGSVCGWCGSLKVQPLLAPQSLSPAAPAGIAAD